MINKIRSFLYIFYPLAIFSIVDNYIYNFFNINQILDLILLVYFAFNIKRIDFKLFFWWLLFVCYFVFSFIYALYDNHHVGDFLLIYKFIIYLILISFLKKHNFNLKDIINLYYHISFSFLITYATLTLLGFERPILFVENNFELILPVSLFLLVNIYNGINIGHVMLTFTIVILSGSLSGFLMYAASLIFIFYKNINLKNFLYGLILMMIISIFAISLFESRSISLYTLENIDRFIFFQMFLFEISDWGLIEILFGNPRISSMSSYTCNVLEYYEDLFSYKNDGSCYSVILHLFVFRAILDHGIVIFIGFLIYLYNLLSKTATQYISLAFLSVILLNGLSVSSFNSAFFAISFIIIMSSKNNKLKNASFNK